MRDVAPLEAEYPAGFVVELTSPDWQLSPKNTGWGSMWPQVSAGPLLRN